MLSDPRQANAVGAMGVLRYQIATAERLSCRTVGGNTLGSNSFYQQCSTRGSVMARQHLTDLLEFQLPW